MTLCKDASGNFDLRVQANSNRVFACLMVKGSSVALAGMSFGDQILQINGAAVAGIAMDEVNALFHKSPDHGNSVVVRDRTFEQAVTLNNSSAGHIGFQFKNGKILGLVKDSAAAHNILLTDHHLLEMNGQNVAGVKDKGIVAVTAEAGSIITVTVVPSFIYEHMVK
ncbi:hypothetical protein Cfor_01532, partial [Coptotermes formosanus]